MAYPTINGAAINGAEDAGALTIGIELARAGTAALSAALVGTGNVALAMGAHKLMSGEDVGLPVDGVDLAAPGLHVLLAEQAPSSKWLRAVEFEALSLGAPSVIPAAATFYGVGAVGLALGEPAVDIKAYAPTFSAIEFGAASAVVATLLAAGERALSVGTPSTRLAARAAGVDLVHTGQHSLRADGVRLLAAESAAIELGTPGGLSVRLKALQHSALQAGTHRIDRGVAC